MGIEVQRGSEFRQRLHGLAAEQVVVSAFQVQSDQVLSGNLARGHILHVLWDQTSGFLKFVKSLFQIARFLEFEAACEGLAAGLQIVHRTLAGGGANGIRAKRGRRGRWGICREDCCYCQE